ncbi:hypothetical protein MycrhDRAFT_2816 [Mycolicibacterium rhodesiae JS60]|nr:hypothetical protein MycrhDRAFT_2816 [Mycolicibacterium rhodesiae JS60]
MAGTPLDPQQLMRDVAAKESLDNYGDLSFVEPMTVFFESVAAEANLNAAGVMGLEADAQRWLTNRLRLQAELTRHPQILDEDVSDPIVIVGVPRTGTTKLHRMLGCDPGVQTLPFWRILNPAPFPDAREGEVDPRLVLARGHVEAMSAQAPDVLELHPFVADEPEEEVLLLEMTCRSPSAVLFFRAPTYTSWLLDQPQRPLYEELKLFLQHLQWQNGGRKGRPWVLKSPCHLGRINAILDVFPGATLVHCHRDIATSMTSTCNLIAAARLMRTDELDPLEVGSSMLDLWSREWAANLEQRQQLGKDAQILDVNYGMIRYDALAVIRDIYSSRGAQLSAESEASMLGWEDTHHARTGDYQHSAEYYGLTKERIDEAFADYCTRFEP